MPTISINEETVRPRHPESRTTNSGYFSYVRRWSRLERAENLPPTFREFNRGYGTATRFLRIDPFTVRIETSDHWWHELARQIAERRTGWENYSNNNHIFATILLGFNIIAHCRDELGIRTHHKIDYIQTVRTGRMFTIRRVEPKFNNRAVLKLSDFEFHFLGGCLRQMNLDDFFSKLEEIYNTIPYNHRLANPIITSRTPRRQNRTTRTTGTYIPSRPSISSCYDAPNTPLAREYTSRTADADESISPRELSNMILTATVSPDIRDLIYEMIIRNHIGEEVQEEVQAQS